MSSDGTTGSIIGKNDKFRVTKNGTLRKVNQNGIDGSIGLGRLVKLWRTPDAHSGRGPSSETRMKMKLEKGMPISLNDQVAHPSLMWPTPQHTDHLMNQSETIEAWEKRAKQKKEQGINLQYALRHAVQKVPTPTARDWRDAGPNVNYQKIKKKGRLAGHSGGSLNPTWVEWLMGYPKGWTDLNH
jgi:hypothetical protein